METIFFNMKFAVDDSFNIKMNTDNSFKASLGEITEIKSEPYLGSLDITPTVDEQTFPTKSKMMRGDLTVREIPFESVGNEAGGYTATIGGY
jgi:hypothetical protein